MSILLEVGGGCNLNSIHDIVATKELYSMKACYAITYNHASLVPRPSPPRAKIIIVKINACVS